MSHKLCKIGHHPQGSLQRSAVLRLRPLQFGLNFFRLSWLPVNFTLDWCCFTLAPFNFRFHRRHFSRKARSCPSRLLFTSLSVLPNPATRRSSAITSGPLLSDPPQTRAWCVATLQVLNKYQTASCSIGTAQMVC